MEPETQTATTIAPTTGFEIHDTVLIKSTGHNYSWYDQEIYGVVMKVSDKEMTVKKPDGEMYEYKVDDLKAQKADKDPNLATVIEKIAHQLYKEEIEKAVDLSRKTMEEQLQQSVNKHKALLEWKESYQNEISFFARLKRFFNQK